MQVRAELEEHGMGLNEGKEEIYEVETVAEVVERMEGIGLRLVS